MPDHPLRVRERIVDKRVLRLLKAFLHGGILTGHGGFYGHRHPARRNLRCCRHRAAGAGRASAGMGADSGQRQTCRRRGEATYPLIESAKSANRTKNTCLAAHYARRAHARMRKNGRSGS
jgi:hypothetical protein